MNLVAVLRNQAPLSRTHSTSGYPEGREASSNIPPTNSRSLGQQRRREREAAQRLANQQLQTPAPTQAMEQAPHTPHTIAPPTNARSLGQQRRRMREAAGGLATQQPQIPLPTQVVEQTPRDESQVAPSTNARSIGQRRRREREAAQRLGNQQLQTPPPTQNASNTPELNARSIAQRARRVREAASRQEILQRAQAEPNNTGMIHFIPNVRVSDETVLIRSTSCSPPSNCCTSCCPPRQSRTWTGSNQSPPCVIYSLYM